MRFRSTARRRLAIAVVIGVCILSTLHAQSNSSHARIALFEPIGQRSDASLSAVLSAVADTIELNLAVLQLYDVRRLPPEDPLEGLQKVRAYCTENRIDQAILGSGAARQGGGFTFRLVVYDRLKDTVSFDRSGSSSGALDMFDTTDALVASMLDGLSGRHILFGSLSVVTDPPGAAVAVNGREVGPAPVSLRGIPVGTVTITARADGREDASKSAVVSDEATTSAAVTLPRSLGILSVKVPSDASVSIRSVEVGEKSFAGPGTQQLPTGEYDVHADSAGLPAVSARVTVTRNQVTAWLPWPKAYLALQATLTGADGAHVFVDGGDRGQAPAIVAVDPGATHQVKVQRDNYNDYVGYFNLSAGEKMTVRPELEPFPGSIRVESSMPGANVTLDNFTREGRTPLVLTNVAVGPHVVRILDLEQNRRIYTVPEPINITVGPGEAVTASGTFVAGKTSLRITDAPSGSVLAVDGQDMDEKAFTTGVVVASGEMLLDVKAPDSEGWSENINARPGQTALSVNLMPYRLARRTIAMNGDAENWKGLVPAVLGGSPYGFNGQPGTAIAQGFVCRDENTLYVRYEFKDGTPTVRLSKSIDHGLQYIILIDTDHGEIQAKIRLDGNSISTHMGVSSLTSRAWTELGEHSFDYRISRNAIDVAIPLFSILRYLKGNTLYFSLVSEKVGPLPQENWEEGRPSSKRVLVPDF